jgi:hypothetical protein
VSRAREIFSLRADDANGATVRGILKRIQIGAGLPAELIAPLRKPIEERVRVISFTVRQTTPTPTLAPARFEALRRPPHAQIHAGEIVKLQMLQKVMPVG